MGFEPTTLRVQHVHVHMCVPYKYIVHFYLHVHVLHPHSSTGTPGPNTPQSFHRRQPTFATQRERLYRAGPGRYVALEDVEPQQSDDVPLRRGMEVEGVYFSGRIGRWGGQKYS